jgi:hypothetical protein
MNHRFKNSFAQKIRMKTIKVWSAPAIALLFLSCRKEKFDQPVESVKEWSVVTINRTIREATKNQPGFDWSMASDDMLWSALNASDGIASVGFRLPSAAFDLQHLHEVDLQSDAWQAAQSSVLQLILESEREIQSSLTIDSVLVWPEYTLPLVNVFLRNPLTISRLRNCSMIRYIEPMGYDRILAGAHPVSQKISSSSGCDGNLPESGFREGSDFQWTVPFARQSWHLSHHQVPLAWTRSSGRGIRVMIIDTGLETDQENLNGSFNQGYSSGRQLESTVTLPRNTFLGIPTGPTETPDDRCGHGTAMAGVCVGPRGTDGNAVGVAYNSSLLTCRAASDVFLDESREVKGVADAFTFGANRSDVHIQSMSMGRLTSSGQIRDAIYYAVGKGKLVFCAAGTSLGWTSGWYGVIFPASLPVVQAVTGVYAENIQQSCGSCHDGSSVDFTVVMEKGIEKPFPLSVAAYGDMPSTIGGSSVATATMAGMAAVVWSRFPTYNANQVLNQLVISGEFYPFKHGSLGWGNVNLDLATR